MHSQQGLFAHYVSQREVRERKALASLPKHRNHAFVNPFQIDDLLIFDLAHLGALLASAQGFMCPEQLAWGTMHASDELVQRILDCLPSASQTAFLHARAAPSTHVVNAHAEHLLLDQLFWELTYWYTPELYEELTAGEQIHPGIFEQLAPWIRESTVLDIGAGSGRASLAALRHGAKLIYAIEPSPGLRQLLCDKLARAPDPPAMIVRAGEFAHIPLPAHSVDLALSCSAFTAQPTQGGEAGFAELRRVTRPGGLLAIIWPRPQDRAWLRQHAFHYVKLPCEQPMAISFASWQQAWRCTRRFYGENQAVLDYLLYAHEPRIPFHVLGMNAPCDYCWLQII